MSASLNRGYPGLFAGVGLQAVATGLTGGVGLGRAANGGGPPVTPLAMLPTVAVAPSLAYGVGKIMPTFSGSPIQLKSTTDTGTVYDVPLAADGSLDTSGYAAWIGSNATITQVTQLTDQTGNGYHATRRSAIDGPVFLPDALVAGRHALYMNNTNRGMTIPAAHVVDRASVTIFAVFEMQRNSTSGGYALVTLGGSVNNFSVLRSGTSLMDRFASYQSPICRPLSVSRSMTTTNGANQDIARVDGNEVATVTWTALSMAGGTLGNVSSSWTTGIGALMAFIVYPATLSAGDKTLLESWASARFNTMVTGQAALPSIVWEGDSITANAEEVGRTLGRYTYNALITPTNMLGQANSGDFLSGMYATRATVLAAAYQAGRSRYILHLFGGTNDIQNINSDGMVKAAVTTTGSGTSGTNTLTVSSGTGIKAGQQVYVVQSALAGESYVVSSVAGTTVTLTSNLTAVVNAGTTIRFGVRTTTTGAVSNSATIPVTDATDFAVGQTISINGAAPSGMTVVSVPNATTVVISAAVTIGVGNVMQATDQTLADGFANALWSTYLLPYIQYAQTYPSQAFSVVVGTIIPRQTFSHREMIRMAFNTLITSNKTTYGYRVADYGAIPQFSTGAPYNYPSTTYIPDGVHPNAAGYALMGPIAAAELNAYLA